MTPEAESPTRAPHKPHKEQRTHIANHPASPTIHRDATTRQLTGADLNQLQQLGYKATERTSPLHSTDTNTIRDQAARGERGEHDLLDALTIDELRNPRT